MKGNDVKVSLVGNTPKSPINSPAFLKYMEKTWCMGHIWAASGDEIEH